MVLRKRTQSEHKEVKIDAGLEKDPTRLKAVEEFRRKLLSQRDKKIKQVEKAFDDRIKKHNAKVAQRAIGAWETMKRKQVNEIAEFYKQKIEQFDEETKKPAQDLKRLSEKMREDVEQKAELRRMLLITLMESKMAGEEVTTEEIAEIDKAVNGLLFFEKNNQDLEPLFEKLLQKKEKLQKKDYERVVGMLNPHDITKKNAATTSGFESTAAGILVSAMDDAQKEELIKVFMEKKRDQTPMLIDAFLETGIITEEQAQRLLKGTTFADDVEAKIASGHYQKAREENAREADKHIQKYRGLYAENINNRFWFKKPFWGLLGMVWGIATFGANALVARKKGEKNPLKWASRVLKNPYAWAGVAATAAGAEIAATGMKTGGWVGAGPIARGFSKLGEEEKKPPSVEENVKERLAEIRESGSKTLVAYLENGGFKTIRELALDIKQKKEKKRTITIDGLLAFEKNPSQIRRLKSMKIDPFVSEETVNDQLATVSEGTAATGIKTNEAFLAAFTPPTKPSKRDATV